MPRRNRHRQVPSGLGVATGWASAESGDDGEWLVRTVPGAQATKTYRCPGCDHEIRPGVAHVVAWPADEAGSVADRRHWHRSCWQARSRRGPTRRR
ncbi:hypothetical protein BAY61_25320 [Prauserella marina]|uniref:Uncharacterized protein n=1 Tax=Prauserella marina TaxID=530584 RepID=A0A222VVB9_9PSEU|nr:hypothetical protein [Prauserella marina]ASR37772.1 hypothetical protein BAY61_25320 [Prauserella marina]PWV75724.1 hypothetical protein DES30_106342 [Prauserella marina]SDD27796.1 hypothetical protein SAMN05421630_10799 [Prauserella marina]